MQTAAFLEYDSLLLSQKTLKCTVIDTDFSPNARSVERKALNLAVVGSSPTVGVVELQ